MVLPLPIMLGALQKAHPDVLTLHITQHNGQGA